MPAALVLLPHVLVYADPMRGSIRLILMAMVLASPAWGQEAPALPGPESAKTPAQVRADTLDRLFAALHGKSAEANAKSIEAKIWDIWMASDSPTAEVLLRQASKATDEGAPEEALKILDKLVERYPDFAEAWNRRATLYFLMHRYDAALADIDKVLALEPRHFGALAGRGMIYERQKNYSAAMEAYREALAINPGMEGPQEALKALESVERDI
jgi:tetratricopeptide (TPR) repeat protein